MATLKSFLETAIAKVSMRKLTTFGTGVNISSAISNTEWGEPTDYYPPSDGVIVYRTSMCSHSFLGRSGQGLSQWRFSWQNTDGGDQILPVQKGQGVSIWCSGINSDSSYTHVQSATFYPFA